MATSYLYRTCSSATDNKKFTLSFWVKRGNQANATASDNDYLFHNISLSPSTQYSYVLFQRENTSELDRFIWRIHTGGSNVASFVTSAKFRDTSAWYHIVIKCDTTQSTESERVKIYINGVLETNWEESTYPSQNQDTFLLSLTGTGQVSGQGNFRIGAYPPSSHYFNGSMTHIHATDGYAYDASTFGETDSTSGIWKPKTAPSVTYGTNGFFLKMENSSDMGEDSSGNNNDFTTSGTITQTEDTPSNNFATGNPIANGGGNLTFTNGNTTIYDTDSTWRSGFGGLAPSSGKWYFEVKHAGSSSNVWIGIMDSSQLDGTGAYKFMEKSRGYGYSAGGEKGNNSSTGAGWGASYTQNDIIGVAMDLDNAKIYFSKNGVFQDSGDPTSGATGTGSMYDLASGYNYFPATSLYSSTAGVSFNFGNGKFGTTSLASSNSDSAGLGLFEYSVPSGYYALCTKNIKNYG